MSDNKIKQSELAASEERYRSLINLAVDGILLGSPEGFITEANERMCQLLDMTRAELLGLHVSKLPFTPESIAANPLRFDLLQKGEIILRERAFIRRDGSVVYFEMRSRMMPDGTYQSIYHDITERKKIEKELIASKELFFTAFATSPDAVNINRLSDGVYVAINHGFTKIMGYTEEEVIGSSSISEKTPIWAETQDRERLVAGLQKDGEVRELIAPFRKKDGTIIIGQMSAKIIILNGEKHILSVTRDITERQRAIDLLKENEERFRNMFEDHSAVMLLVEPRSGDIVDCNKAAVDFYGYKKEQLCSLNIEMINTLSKEEILAARLRTLEKKQNYFEFPHRLANGEIRIVEVHSSPVVFGDKKFLFSIVHDITERKRAEEEKQNIQRQLFHSSKLATIGTLAAGIAHEINNPLMVISGYTKVIEKEIAAVNNPEKLKTIQRISAAARRIETIVSGLKTLARQDSTSVEVVDIHNCIEETLLLVRTMYEKENVKIVTNFEAQKSKISANSGKFAQVIMNLVVNARDALISKRGGIITISTKDNEGQINLSVSDNGPGIHPELVGQIFDPFFTTKAPGKGTGLGLSISHSIIESFGGEMRVESQLGAGATFTIILPAT